MLEHDNVLISSLKSQILFFFLPALLNHFHAGTQETIGFYKDSISEFVVLLDNFIVYSQQK